MNLAPTIVFVPVLIPTAGSSFPRVIGERHGRTGKTPNGWPPLNRQPIPTEETRRMLDAARRDLAEEKARRLLRELTP
jgi:hypothetical protein